MRKTRIIVAMLVATVLILVAGIVNAAGAEYTVSYEMLEDDQVKATVTFSEEVIEVEDIPINWDFVDSKTITRTFKQGEYFTKAKFGYEGEMIYEIVVCAPIELEVGEYLEFKESLNYVSSDTSVIKVEGRKIKAVAVGTATLTAQLQLQSYPDDNHIIDLKWDVKVTEKAKDEETNTDNDNTEKTDEEEKNTNETNTDNNREKTDEKEQNTDDKKTEDTDTNTINWTDSSKMKISLDNEKTKFNKVSVTTNYKYSDDDIGRYYLYVSKNPNEKISSLTDLKNKEYATLYANNDGYLTGTIYDNLAELPGDNYAYVLEQIRTGVNAGKQKLIVNAQKLDEYKLPRLGNRFDIWLFDAKKTETSNMIFASKDRKVHYKIGKITSNDILKSLKNESSDISFAKLLKYAKETKEMKEGTINIDGQDTNLIADLDIENGAYYYAYMVIDSQDGKYVEAEDVAVYQAIIENDEKTMVHFAFSSIDIKEDDASNKTDEKKEETKEDKKEEKTKENKEESKKDDTTAKTIIPNTGVNTTAISIIGITAIAGIAAFIGYRKYHEVK